MSVSASSKHLAPLELSVTSNTRVKAIDHYCASVGGSVVTAQKSESLVSLLFCMVGSRQHAAVLFRGRFRVYSKGSTQRFRFACAQRFSDEVLLSFSDTEEDLVESALTSIDTEQGRPLSRPLAVKLMSHRSSCSVVRFVRAVKDDLKKGFSLSATPTARHETNCVSFSLRLLQVLVPSVSWNLHFYQLKQRATVVAASDSDSGRDGSCSDTDSESEDDEDEGEQEEDVAEEYEDYEEVQELVWEGQGGGEAAHVEVDADEGWDDGEGEQDEGDEEEWWPC